MPQRFIDWEMAEAKDCGKFQYEIFKVEDAEHKIFYKGFVVFPTGDYWIENTSLDSIRSALWILGQQAT